MNKNLIAVLLALACALGEIATTLGFIPYNELDWSIFMFFGVFWVLLRHESHDIDLGNRMERFEVKLDTHLEDNKEDKKILSRLTETVAEIQGTLKALVARR